jgi:hypothetical protein
VWFTQRLRFHCLAAPLAGRGPLESSRTKGGPRLASEAAKKRFHNPDLPVSPGRHGPARSGCETTSKREIGDSQRGAEPPASATKEVLRCAQDDGLKPSTHLRRSVPFDYPKITRGSVLFPLPVLRERVRVRVLCRGRETCTLTPAPPALSRSTGRGSLAPDAGARRRQPNPMTRARNVGNDRRSIEGGEKGRQITLPSRHPLHENRVLKHTLPDPIRPGATQP